MDGTTLTLQRSALYAPPLRGAASAPSPAGGGAEAPGHPADHSATTAANRGVVRVAAAALIPHSNAASPAAAAEPRRGSSIDGFSRPPLATPESGSVVTVTANGDLTQNLSEAELDALRELSARDREVRAHEAAHAAAGGGLAGAPTYSFTRGPDGRLYATGGEVRIDTAPVAGDPAATISKARTVIRAATAPANPSPQDLRAAAEARALLASAQAELAAARAAERSDGMQDGMESETAPSLQGPDALARPRSAADDASERSNQQVTLQRQMAASGGEAPERVIGALLDISV